MNTQKIAEFFHGEVVKKIDPTRVARIYNGAYTVQNLTTGEHRTFRISTQPKDSKFAPGRRVVSLLIGRDNHNDYQKFGFVNDHGITVWKKFQGMMQRSNWEWFAYIVWNLATQNKFVNHRGEAYKLMHESTCIRCNRKLTEPTSIRTGVGPECRSILGR
jgi:hypothetical protein